MIIEEILSERLVKHYSDQNLMMEQVETGINYSEAVDVRPCRYTYVETDIPIEPTGEDATEEDYQNALNRLGVNTDEEG